VEDIPLDQYKVSYPYTMSGPLEGWLRRNTVITDTQYGEDVTVIFETAQKDVPAILQDLSRGQAVLTLLGTVYREKEI
jgi:hypothetical protein